MINGTPCSQRLHAKGVSIYCLKAISDWFAFLFQGLILFLPLVAKAVPFRVILVTDGFELNDSTAGDIKSTGFKLRYTQNAC